MQLPLVACKGGGASPRFWCQFTLGPGRVTLLLCDCFFTCKTRRKEAVWAPPLETWRFPSMCYFWWALRQTQALASAPRQELAPHTVKGRLLNQTAQRGETECMFLSLCRGRGQSAPGFVLVVKKYHFVFYSRQCVCISFQEIWLLWIFLYLHFSFLGILWVLSKKFKVEKQ